MSENPIMRAVSLARAIAASGHSTNHLYLSRQRKEQGRRIVAALDALDHEAAVEEWRCPRWRGAEYEHDCWYSEPSGVRQCLCGEPLRRVLVVLFREEESRG